MAATRTKKKSSKKKSSKKKVSKKKVSKKTSRAGQSTKGKTLDLNVKDTWIKIFSDNEKAAKKNKMTDEEINKFMMKEFPDRTSTDITTVKGVQAARRAYVRGVFTGGEPQESYKYNEEGEKIKPSGKPLEGDEASAPAPAKKKSSKKKSSKKKRSRKKAA